MTATNLMRTAMIKQGPLSCYALSLLERIWTLAYLDLSNIPIGCGPPAGISQFPATVYLDLHNTNLTGTLPQGVQ